MPGFNCHLRICSVTLLLVVLTGCQVVTVPFQLPSFQPTATATADEPAPGTGDLVAEPTAVVAQEDAAPPVRMEIPELALDLPIVPMGWVVTDQNGERTTAWIVPTEAIGWQVNSAGAGGAGNLILSGHQALGDALFAPLALGDIAVGQTVILTDANGARFRYQISEVSDPIPILGATEDDNALARSYLQSSETPILTMMTGWPDFTTTHRIFAVAELIGAE